MHRNNTCHTFQGLKQVFGGGHYKGIGLIKDYDMSAFTFW